MVLNTSVAISCAGVRQVIYSFYSTFSLETAC